MLYKKLAKPVLFRMDPEAAHHLTIRGLSIAGKVPGAKGIIHGLYGMPKRAELHMKLWGIGFANPVGLAAGLDKNAEAVEGFSQMGFGFMEVGTVTPRPQEGNEKPRLFRLPEYQALINRMGFNNVGAEKMARTMSALKNRPIPVAVNIGKNKVTPNEDAEEDYRICIRTLYKEADFFVVNISSPNTPDLRSLQHGSDLLNLLHAVTDEMHRQQARYGDSGKPVLVKIAPDLTDEEVENTIHTIRESGVAGIIVSNTTISREGIVHAHKNQAGGLSGKPLAECSTEMVAKVYRLTGSKMPIIGSGGIFTPEDAYAKFRAGASLVEVYTALIYEGPKLIRRLNEGLIALLKRDGYTHLSQAIGADHR